MDLMVLFFAVIFGALIGWWANSWGRNPWGWGFFGFMLPLVAAIALLICGKTVARKAQDKIEIDRLALDMLARQTRVYPDGPGKPSRSV